MKTPAQAVRIVIRDADSISEMKQVEDLQKEVWGIDDRGVVPFDHLLVAKETGGLLLGAFDGPKMVGFVYGLLAGGRECLQIHSHMLAVKPAYRNLGIGFQLKAAQRASVLSRGITRITWTFDPLRCLNAHFNFRKLGVLSDCYRINYYGETTTSFLHQHGTDRLWVTWLLDSERVCRRLEPGGGSSMPAEELEDYPRLIVAGSDEAPVPKSALAPGAPEVLIEIPEDIGGLERRCPGLATAWREATRRAFTAALDAGYLVKDFYHVRRGGRGSGIYILTLSECLEDFASPASDRTTSPL